MQNSFLQSENHQNDLVIQELNSKITMLKEKVQENENMILHRNTEEVRRLNNQIKDIEENRGFEEGKLRANIANLNMKIEEITQENASLKEART